MRAGRVASGWRSFERAGDRLFGSEDNPLRQLGGLGFLLFWLIAVSGGWLYVYYETSVEGAWRSVQWLTVEQWWGGGLMRSLHRYGSDAFVAVIVLHLVREFALGRFSGFRWYSWVSGVPTLWLAIGSGAIGYWLVWDELGLFVATATAEWFGALPGFGPALVRNFIAAEAVSDRLFSLVAFLHIGLPLALLLAMWAHVQRITRPRTGVSRGLALRTLLTLLALSLAWPATSLPPAEPGRLPAAVAIDWFYLAPLVASDAGTAEAVWTLALGLTLLLAIAPWLRRAPRPAPAVVDPAHCNGCTRCFADCPYAAIAMAPHPQGRGEIAIVDADRCAACGICAGACPSATPFRRAERLASGIDLPWLTVDDLRERLDAGLAGAAGRQAAGPLVVVFECERGATLSAQPPGGPRTAVIALPCAGMVPPSFVEYALRNGADGVVVASCPSLDCEYRFGERWIAERLRGEREPRLRAAADSTRIGLLEVAAGEDAGLAEGLQAFAGTLAAAHSPTRERERG
ncbi:hydrogenase iron-sulfur subunit [Burkholderiaceae bacterium FT117]|uniref:hydrogenase iron-sulfur subunit n=1 Tax=Zeimonas sediminis TaxID=2944268 RepID=UPI002342E882|nr:cytochrome b N-terminal domain-containing protein [Zeimonas sediminis]MCM5569490.1 hydrogenase iron-sulfur subunit [Zeimonas sediminis]